MANESKPTGQGRNDQQGSRTGGREIEAPDTHRSDSKSATMGGRDQQDQNKHQGGSPGTMNSGSASTSAPGRGGQSQSSGGSKSSSDSSTNYGTMNKPGGTMNKPGTAGSSDSDCGCSGASKPAGRDMNDTDEARDSNGSGRGIAGAASAGSDKARGGAQPGGKKS